MANKWMTGKRAAPQRKSGGSNVLTVRRQDAGFRSRRPRTTLKPRRSR
jgi:hypothetical protein